ncbi:MerR HTH family regulatory protein [Amycolatopsis arida]|uniref:MerR HTH family regulatory protein n=1 Tax=Amycolatopsis arida TaxID=587909 RepID=A0A1I5LUZ0_9PSEU|nr:helix-turn-helix domain-containing protein [Amycolatopsis arida]TDX93840.1 MerR-like DNA binding protein [Amycolatopsis arida]SFP00581.1 MerR HTH family regulatory protein [Amycolatopsis arida]
MEGQGRQARDDGFRHGEVGTTRLDRLDDEHYPAYTTGQAAELLGVEQPFLRSLDTAGAVSPQRSSGGHRRYSRHQLGVAGRLRELVDEGHTLAAARRILDLEAELAEARAEIARLRRLDAGGTPNGDGGPNGNGGRTGTSAPAGDDGAAGAGRAG